jgi:hypothetical protein
LTAISEKAITKTTLQFLKAYYRFREREGRTQLSSDRRGAGGIVADGFLSYPKKGGELFQATFEATSLDKRHEVAFRLRRPLLRWDAAAVAATLSAGAYVGGYFIHWWSVARFGLWGCIALVLFLFVLFYFLYLLLFRRKRRYRYIYAVEQFKQYFADEQWIAIGEDVFANFHQDPYYQELRRQCILNGFGLIVVRADGQPQMQITPSRQDLFKAKRSNIPLLSPSELKRLMPPGKAQTWMQQFRGSNLRRYKYQFLFCLLSALLVGDLLYQEVQALKTEEVEDAEAYRRRMEKARAGNIERYLERDPDGFVMDTPFVWPYPIRSDIEPYTGVGLQVAEAAGGAPKRPASRQEFLAQLEIGDGVHTYDCSRVRNLRRTAYIVQAGKYASFREVQGRIRELQSYGFMANAVWLGCFNELEGGYALYLGLIFDEISAARSALLNYRERLGDNVLGLELRLRSLSPKQED